MKTENLTDVTFIFPVRIDSQERLNNLFATYSYLSNHFSTNFIICEAATSPTPHLEKLPGYFFVKDDQTVFYYTYYLNKMIKMCNTPIVGIWDVDALAPVNQICEAVNAIRKMNFCMAWPYDGIFYKITKEDSNVFMDQQNIDVIINNTRFYYKMFGKHSVGGAFFVKKTDYMSIGLENENIYGWGPEDIERFKRATILEVPIYRVKGNLYHLYHPRYQNSVYSDQERQLKNINELLRICRFSKEELQKEIESWNWCR